MKTNKTKPISEAELRKIKRDATSEAVNKALYLMLFCLYNKSGFDTEMLAELNRQVEELSDDIKDGRVKWSDIAKALGDELGVSVARRGR